MKKKLAFISAGLGNISRGFEISAATWVEELKQLPQFDVRLFSGAKYQDATPVWNLPRNGNVAKLLRKINFIKDGCRLERITYGLGFLSHVLTYRPDVIWLQEGTIGDILLSFRKVFGLSYKLVFCDGAPIGYHLAKQFDYLIFLHDYAREEALLAGADLEKCIVIPHLSLFPTTEIDKTTAKASLGLNPQKLVIICVAAWNKHHKRVDYLLRETAKLGPDVTLLLCGQEEKESDELKAEAAQLGLDVQWRTLNQKELSVAYRAADFFVLPSLHEGLGVVLIEAGAHSLPIISHPHQGARYILGENYFGLADLSEEGNFARQAQALLQRGPLPEQGAETFEIIDSKFNKKILIERFVKFIDMICKK
ncbi:MAG TPA: glycosyltransferase family 4 protein [Hymenobacter sp.]|jgi:glycosyltransferase involved in cell wall biosynthesis|uniref:glycosyltransferase family 4 protein n=1 Tax=Hymenobacter sp. TaxID=1898978 RepID=UPI002ED864D0